ncbi:ArsC/Spx/MgsR family protein [Pedobacter miscanthi]|uniref:Arsenate reductase n=1 Tax=Pedobacter miscanthi TaxID=2259170 RepID=A0A366KZ31_9SPHI|nr:hypothetical protein DRW42_13485 [Pedobacter miscanthi]
MFFNKKGSAYKQLDSKAKEGLKKKADILAMLHSNPLLIKRPAIEDGDFLYFGFDETSCENHFFHQP